MKILRDLPTWRGRKLILTRHSLQIHSKGTMRLYGRVNHWGLKHGGYCHRSVTASPEELIQRWLTSERPQPKPWRDFVRLHHWASAWGDHRLPFRKQAEHGFPLHLAAYTLSIQMHMAWPLAVQDLSPAPVPALSLRYSFMWSQECSLWTHLASLLVHETGSHILAWSLTGLATSS